MVQHLETAQDVRTAFGLAPPATDPASADKPTEAKPVSTPAADTFPLSRSYEVKGVVFSEIKFREPRGLEYWKHGEPQDWRMVDDGLLKLARNYPVIRAYAEACASVPGEPSITGADILEALNLADTLAVQNGVIGFFDAAEA